MSYSRAVSGTHSREENRVLLPGELRGEIMVFQSMVVREISRTGVTIDTHIPLHIDSLHDVRLALGDRSVVVKARVAHSHITDVDQDTVVYRSGLEFVEPSGAVATAILSFVEEANSGRRGV